MAVHVVGQVDVDGRGIAGIERQMDQRLRSDNSPLRLSIDSRLQISLRDAVNQAITDFSGIGGAGIVMDVQTAEVLAMVSLPDYDGNDPQSARHCDPELNRRTNICERFNRATAGVFEPGSTFKLMTAAMALETGTVNIWNGFDASRPIRVGRFTIEDYRGKHRWLAFPEILAYSSNIGTAHMASAVGPTRHRDFMNSMGMLRRIPIELPETVTPLAPSANSWRDINTMTIGFGHGIAVTPLHVITGVSALVNGGILRNPSIVAAAGQPRDGVRVVSERTSEIMRRVMRLVVTDGSGRGADVPGYFVGGKTGTAQKTDTHGRYMENKRIAAFVGAFPMNDPKYAIYVMVDEPSPNARSHGYATAGWVAAPAAGQVIGRIAPILGLAPEPAERIAEIQQRISIPMQPTRPANTAPTRPSSASGGVLTAPRAESRDRR
jgi:cell division protein FtsI (penicillin-binding protein 3)